MIIEEITNIWSSQFYSLVHFTNITNFFLTKLQYEGTSRDRDVPDAFTSFRIFALWAVLYFTYKRFLNLLLRRMQFPLVKRNRISDGLWSCSFSACSIIFLLYFVPESRDVSCPWRKPGNLQLGFLIHKAFYLHEATVQVFVHGSWMQGWTSQLFASSIPIPSREKWPGALTVLLLYKACDAVLLNICKILMTLSRTENAKRVTKFLFFLHFVNWIYVHVLLVPGNLIFYEDKYRSWRMQYCLWMWLICELLNSIRNKEFACIYSKKSLESSLFPVLCEESVQFVNILKKHRNASNNKMGVEGGAQKQKTELWQTLFCAMTMKKKLKKRRESKRAMEQEHDDEKENERDNESPNLIEDVN